MAIWLSACGGGAGGSIPLENLDEEITKTFCANAMRCGGLPEGGDCSVVAPNNSGQLEASVMAGRATYDGAAASDCIATDLAGGDCTNSQGIGRTASDRCAQVFQGKVAVGEPCLVDVDCVSLRCDIKTCDDANQCCRGTCAAEIPMGGTCLGLNPKCVSGTVCVPAATGATPTCAVPAKEGQPCHQYNACALGLWCDGGAGGTSTCIRLPKRGAACVPGGPPCDSSLDGCDPVTSTCVARRAVGAACTDSNNCPVYAFCAPATKTCVAKAAVGEPCTMGDDCQGFLDCNELGICAKSPPWPVCSLN